MGLKFTTAGEYIKDMNMKWAIMVVAAGMEGEKWIYVSNKNGSPIVFDTHAAAEDFASSYKHHKIVEYV